MRFLAAATVSFVLVAAGCGSSDEDPTVAWADGVCSALTTWNDSLTAARDSLQDTGSLSPEAVGDALTDVVGATKQLGEDLREVGAPETESGEQAQQIVGDLSDTLSDGAETLQQTIDEGGDAGLGGILESLQTISTTLGSMAVAVGTAFGDLQELDPEGELQDAISSAESCEAFGSS
jgi:hypothetical protein